MVNVSQMGPLQILSWCLMFLCISLNTAVIPPLMLPDDRLPEKEF